RTEAEKAADLAAAEQAREDKAQKERDADLTLMRKILSWKKGGEPVAITKTAVLDGVNKGRDGYPTSIKLKPTDGSTLTDDKFDLAALFRNRKRGESVPESKRRVRELVDAVRAEAATEAAQDAVEQEQSPAKADSTIPLLQAHEAAMEQARDGKIEAEAFRAAFAQVEGNREAILAELNSMNKEKLLRAGGVHFYHRYKSEKKDRVVEALYRSMLDEYALGKSYGPTSYMMTAAGMESHRQAKAQALRDLVAGTDADALSQYAAEVAELRKERESRKEATQKALTDPQTLAEFRSAITYNAERHAETRREAYLRLTPEQRRRYDALEAESTREARDQAKAKQRTKIASAGNTTAGEVIATKHTKHGHDLYVVKLEERVSREDYDTLNSSAKRMGGSYSSYRGNGAIPGFQFRTREAAEAFRKLVAGDTEAAQEVAQARRDAFEDDRSQSAVERLRTMAAALNERAEEELGRDRKANTARRARMASAAEAAANANKALAGTMENIADAIEAGKAKFLDLVRQKVQVEFLGTELRNAKDAQIRAKYPSYADQVKHQGQPIDDETVDYSDYPTYGGMRSDLAGIARQMIEVDGLKNLGQRLLKVADDVSDAYVEWAKNNLQSVSRFARGEQFAEFTSRDDAERAIRRSNLSDRAIVLPLKRGVNRIVLSPSEAMKQGIWQGDDKRIALSGDFGREIVEAVGRRAGSKIKLPWQLETVHAKRKRLEGMGIYTGSEYRAALREFADLQQAMATPDKIKQMERAMIGRRSDGLDFFPTSEAVVDAMLEAAEIAEGMGVLEPSAGMGHIADAIREKTGVEPDVVELSGERRELLQAKGYHLAGDDFMAMQPRTFYTFGDVFQAPDGTKGIMHGGAAWSGRASLHAINEDGSEGKMLGWYDRDELTGIEQRGSWSGYDRIVMNPPFSKGRDIQHVQHAYSLLKPGGRLVAIMGEGAFFQSNSAAEGFRAWLDDLGATSERLPENSFMDAALPVNTAVNARMVVIDKPATDTSGITADSARRAAVRARVAANNYSREDENFLQGMLKALYEKTGNSVLEHKLSTWLDSRYQRLEAVDQLYAEHDKAFAGKDDVLFSRRPVNVARGATPVLSHDAVKAIVERVNARLNLGTQLAVYRSEAELFAAAPEIERQAENDQAKGQINAVYHNGKVHVVTSAFVFEADVEGAILDALAHEGQGHYGIRALFRGDRQAIDTALREFFAAIGGVAGVRRLAAKNDIDLSLYLNTAASMGERQRAGYLADELLAHLQGKAATASLTQRAAAAAKAYLGAIREWLRNHGFTNLAKGTDADIALLLKRMRDASTLAASSAKGAPRFSLRPLQTKSEAFKRWFGKSKVVGADGQPLNLYHGTAADFTVFDQSRAGLSTGHTTAPLGIFLTSDGRSARAYAEKASDGIPGYGRVMDLYASIQNPYLMSVEESQEVGSPLEARRLRTRLEQQGYDGIRLKGTPVWIAFNNYQVKSATDNVGTFDEFDPDIRFSRSAVRDMASNAANAIASVSVQDVKRSALGKWTDFLSLGLQSLGRRQLVDLYDGMLPMRKYAKLVERMDADKNDTGAAADELARRWGKLKDSGKLADLMHEATLAQTDADPLVPESKAVNPGRRDALIKQFEQLSPEAQAIYREARDAYKAHHRNVIEAIKERVKRSEMGSERKAELLRKMDSEFYKAIQGVYFPLARFGSYVVAVNGPDGKIASVHRAETMGEANALREQLQQKFPRDSGYDVGKVTLDKEFIASRDSVSRGFMSELYGALDGMKLPSSQLAELEDTLGQLYLASMPDLSWAKHGIHRKGTAGFSDDARRAFAQNLFHGARYLAKLRYGDRMQDELDRMQKYADARKQDADYDQPKAQRVIDEMVKRHESMMNPKSNPLSTALTSFGFIYYLGLSPAAAVVNLTQTALVAYPVMGAKWGFNKSAAALMKASNEAVRGKNDITKSLSPEELKAFEKAVRDGTIDVTQAHDLAGIAQGEDSKVMWKIRPVMRMASYMFHQAEVFNRQVTFVASYRLAREAGASTTAAYEQAKKATYDGHFDYSASNRPRLMQGNVAKVVLLFKQYAQNMIYTLTRNTYQAFAGESPAVRKEARKTIGAILALHAAAAGVLGLPLVGPLLALASAVGGDDDEPWDAEVALRNLLADALGPKASEVIARGLSRLGPADISGRVALNNLLLPDVQEGLEGKKLAEAWTSAMLGPVAGIFTNAAVGANHIAEGRYAMGLESMLPVALRNPLKSLRYADEGVVDRSGVVVLDEVGIAGIASQLAGFSPSEVRLSFEGKSAIFNADRRLSDRRSELMTQFARAAMEGDQKGMAEAREAIAAFNQKNPSRRIQANHLMQSVQARRRRIAQAEDGVYLPRNRADAREAGRFANPE
ncbi:PLxRFG domain-containing protein, partial [Pseudomonas sp. GW6]